MKTWRVVKRERVSPRRALWVRAAALLGALLCGSLLLLLLGFDPVAVFRDILDGAVGRPLFRQETVKNTVPLLITAVGVAFAYRMRFFNTGAEGQILMGAAAASAVAIYFGEVWPKPLLLVCMGLAGVLGGGLFALPPAFCKAKWGTNETLFTLMLNYVATLYVQYLSYCPNWQSPGTTFPKIRSFTEACRLPQLFGVHIGWVFALLVAAWAWGYFRYTKHGYEIAVVGASQGTARYAGMDIMKITLRTLFISGGLAGLAGYLVVSGADGTLSTSTSGGMGFTAISVAWLAKMQPGWMLLSALFIAMLRRGSNRVQTTLGLPQSAAEVLIGIILFFILGCEFFLQYKLVRGKEETL